MSPIHIGPVAAPIFGLWTATPAVATQPCVICPPFGHEYVVSYRALRLLAEDLSRHGSPALRFDYFGTGDAAGEIETATLELWIRSAAVATDEVKRRTRATSVSLIGLRVGATVALRTALQRPDVDSLVLWDPVLDGESYLSELRARHEDWARAYAVTHRRSPPGGEDHLLGYPMSPRLHESLEAVRHMTPKCGPARRVLIVTSRAGSGTERLSRSLGKLGVSVELRMIPEADVWNQSVDIVLPGVPRGVLRDIRLWLIRASDGDEGSEVGAVRLASPPSEPLGFTPKDTESPGWGPSLKLDPLSERPVVFGQPGHLVGVLALPETSHVAPSAIPSSQSSNRGTTDSQPALILLNAGLLHRVGPQRLWVRIARRLARNGHTVLRFDYSGVGDSSARRDRIPFHESRVLETRTAMEFLTEETGHQHFVLLGLCTGADYAFRTALEDSRVVGLVLLDAYPFRTPGWYWRHYGKRLLRPTSWWRLLSGRYSFGKELISRVKPPASPRVGEDLARQIPTRDEMAEQLRELVKRGVQLQFLYTGGLPAWYNYAGQFEAAFGRFGGQVEVIYLGEADHVFTPLACQRELMDRLECWLKERFELTGMPPAAFSVDA